MNSEQKQEYITSLYRAMWILIEMQLEQNKDLALEIEPYVGSIYYSTGKTYNYVNVGLDQFIDNQDVPDSNVISFSLTKTADFQDIETEIYPFILTFDISVDLANWINLIRQTKETL